MLLLWGLLQQSGLLCPGMSAGLGLQGTQPGSAQTGTTHPAPVLGGMAVTDMLLPAHSSPWQHPTCSMVVSWRLCV